jgi:hypothetical protein
MGNYHIHGEKERAFQSIVADLSEADARRGTSFSAGKG